MAAVLRRLSFYVDEPVPGQYYWVLHESTGDPTVWVDIRSSEQSCDTWADAWSAGHMVFLKMVADRQAGPRVSGDDENADPVG